MLVKHNLLDLPLINLFHSTSQAKNYDINYKNNIISFKGVKRPETPYIFGYYYENYKNNFSKLIIKNTGESPIVINEPYKNNVKQSDITLLPGEYTEISRKNLADGFCTWIKIPNIDEYSKSYEIKIINFTVTEDGFADIYLPNITALSKEKQPLLPPEGNYKEITPL
ncbi:hypothetical protein NH288_05360 [Anaerococcus sp. NML200537]|uniref:hypothetical protein n=1 Tax=Anaerococcus sp. NML200537 TaxID=2954485 RepID=UPI0022377837|nr:hypothetical protein [Anaerococcus sp. NML200537]MCW6701511.1 hypothetical protein [Anaerococcus sp. NML200537]